MSVPSNLTITSTLPLPKPELSIPQLGFGVYRSDVGVCEASCLTALKAGYRHIDSAQLYKNEAQVGSAVRKSGLKREEVYLTTKILSPGADMEKTYQKCLHSVELMAGEDGYVDLFLVHTPNKGKDARQVMWKALERLYDEGKARAIGVSNYGRNHIEGMRQYAKVWPPHVNQVELHPWCQQREAVEYCREQGIVVEAYCPVVRNYKADDETLVGLAKKYNKTTAQVLIRWSLQKNFVPLPKSDTPERIVANSQVYDFNISQEDIDVLDGLDQGEQGAIVQWVDNASTK